MLSMIAGFIMIFVTLERSDIDLSQVASNAQKLEDELRTIGSRVCEMYRLSPSSFSIKNNYEWYKNVCRLLE